MMGFNDCMMGGDDTKSTLPNYSLVGFGFGGGNQLVPLMHLSFHGIPPLRLDDDDLVISFVIWGTLYWVCAEVMEATFRHGR